MAVDTRTDKHPATPIQGSYGHPIHPILVTIPIGAWVASLVFDFVSRAADNPETFFDGAYWLIGIGIIGAVVSAVFGFLDYRRIAQGTTAKRTATIHLLANDIVIVAFIVSFFLRRAADDQETSIGLIVLSIAALVLLSFSGYLGGKLSYRYGVRVADETTQGEGFRPASRARS